MDLELAWERLTGDPARFWLGFAAVVILLLLVKVSSAPDVVDRRSRQRRKD